MFLESFLPLVAPGVHDRRRIELPFGRGKTSPVAAADVARVVAAVLADPSPHLGHVYELTGPRSQDMNEVAREFSDALNRDVTYADIPVEDWERGLKTLGLPEHLARHVVTMGELHRSTVNVSSDIAGFLGQLRWDRRSASQLLTSGPGLN
jgi:NAD(P)H dehydrogenase (quinone)